ncbi:MAG: GntR family transcriptional regulator, partial [Gammaproteobacteria bacterium]|nr:GntR family transcriptional regulator [Gammaproteobacteria bacterium]
GNLKPGVRLDETALAKQFGVSRTPVREALHQLAAGGMVQRRARQGATVTALAESELRQLFEVMADLEALCARYAARRMTPEERITLQRLHEACAKEANRIEVESYIKLNRRFHEVIYRGTHNAFLEEVTLAISNKLSPYRRFQFNRPGRAPESFREHESILSAILSGDPDRAAREMREHVLIQGEGLNDLISTLPPSYVRSGTG